MKSILIMPALLRRSSLPARSLFGLALCLALLAPACEKKAAKTTPPVLVPSIESAPQPETEPQPASIPEEQPSSPSSPEKTPPPESQKPRPKPRKPPVRKPLPPAVVEAPKPEQPKIEPPRPEANQPEPSHASTPDSSSQITAAVPRFAVQSQTQNTEQLLRDSEAKLAGLNRPLDQSEQAMASQARNYISQSHEALHEGEIERAYNLAVKASLLATELTK